MNAGCDLSSYQTRLCRKRRWEKIERTKKFPKSSRIASLFGEMGMSSQNTERLKGVDWDDAAPRLILFARYWAQTHYLWHPGHPLPGGATPEDVAKEAIKAFALGDRKLNPNYEVFTQLKGAVRSILWNLHQKTDLSLTDAHEPEFFEHHLDRKPDPASQANSNDYYRVLLERLKDDPRVRENHALGLIVAAYIGGAESVAEVSEQTKIPIARIYELRRQLKQVTEEVIHKLEIVP
jgi:hypothetical protein